MIYERAAVLPVTSTEIEPSFSSMSFIKNYLRNRMGDEWLSDLLLLYISGGGKRRFHQLLCTTNISAWFCHQMMAREINYFVNALLIVMAQADCKNHLLITSFITD
jgi:hypothetical protein